MPKDGLSVEVSRSIPCACGERLHVPENYRRRHARCGQCGADVAIPEALLSAAALAHESHADQPAASVPDHRNAKPLEAPECERVTQDGVEFWKMTCVCGKRVRLLVASKKDHGRCRECHQVLNVPAALLAAAKPAPSDELVLDYDALKPAPAAPSAAVPEAARVSEIRTPREKLDALTAPVVEVRVTGGDSAEDEREESRVTSSAARASQRAAQVAAALLRPEKSEANESSVGFLDAWPIAGAGRRILAAFIDLTLALAVAGLPALLASARAMPPVFARWEVALGLLVCAGVANDLLGHLLWSGSLGKKLVVIVTRHISGARVGFARCVCRACCKWLLLPLWFVGLFTRGERALHDRFCGTLVLRGRVRK